MQMQKFLGVSEMEETYVHPSAVLMGDITLGRQVSIWPTAVLRADMASIQVGELTNIQDGSILHVDTDKPLIIGNNVTVGHKAVLHSCTVGNNCLIGIGSIILDDVEIGDNCMIAAGSLVSPGKKIPPNSLVMGEPGRIIRSLTEEEIKKLDQSSKTYWQLALRAMGKEQE